MNPATLASTDTASQLAPWWVLTIPAGPTRARAAPAREGEHRRPYLAAESPVELPSLAEDSRYTVVFDGTVWNAKEIAAQVDGTEAAADPAEIILRAYRRWQADVVAKLRGVYALVIWDGEEQTFLCARDHAGAHPLFYAEAGDDLLVSNSTEALLRHGSVPPALERSTLADHLLTGYSRVAAQTHFAAIKRLPPGHVLSDGAQGRQVYRYWHPAPSETSIEWAGESELERLDELLAQAVDRCLQLGPAALHLSGGIDSATVAVVAADRSRRQGLPAPLALSVLFPDAACNEEAVQRAVGADLGLPHLLTSFDDAVGPGRLLTAALEISARSAAPLLNLFEPAFDHLGTAARHRGYRVVLTGGGGDEWLGLEPSYAVDLVRGFHLIGLYRLWEAKRRYLPLPAHVVLRNNVWRAGLRPVLRNFARRRAPWSVRAYKAVGAYKGRRDADWIPAWIARNAELREELRSRDSGQRPPASASHYLHAKRATLDHPVEAFVAEEAFAASQRLGLRRLEPFWDPDVVDLLCRTPPGLLIRGAREKSVVRELLVRNLPSIGREWPRTVFMDSFASSVMRSQGPAAWGQLDGASALVELGVVDRERVRDFVEGYFASTGHTRDTWRVWSILSVEAWLQARA